MKQISIQDLKATLSVVISEAQAGDTIIITRHNEPVAQLGPPQPTCLHPRKGVATSKIKPAIKRGTRIPYLAVLLEDRGNR